MKMDGYDVVKEEKCGDWGFHYPAKTYRVYQWNHKVKHYRYGYSDYKSMIAAHPELKR